MSILETKDLCKSYKGMQVVKKINLSVESGQVVGLLGPNGAGKTTSFYMVVGLVRSNSGPSVTCRCTLGLNSGLATYHKNHQSFAN